MPTARVFVLTAGLRLVPDSWTQAEQVSSPLPFRLKQPAATGSPGLRLPRGWIAVALGQGWLLTWLRVERDRVRHMGAEPEC